MVAGSRDAAGRGVHLAAEPNSRTGAAGEVLSLTIVTAWKTRKRHHRQETSSISHINIMASDRVLAGHDAHITRTPHSAPALCFDMPKECLKKIVRRIGKCVLFFQEGLISRSHACAYCSRWFPTSLRTCHLLLKALLSFFPKVLRRIYLSVLVSVGQRFLALLGRVLRIGHFFNTVNFWNHETPWPLPPQTWRCSEEMEPPTNFQTSCVGYFPPYALIPTGKGPGQREESIDHRVLSDSIFSSGATGDGAICTY